MARPGALVAASALGLASYVGWASLRVARSTLEITPDAGRFTVRWEQAREPPGTQPSSGIGRIP